MSPPSCEDLILAASDFLTGPDRGAKLELLHSMMQQADLSAVYKEFGSNHYLEFPYDWRFLDPVYVRIRNSLDKNLLWPFGMAKVTEQIKLFEPGLQHIRIKDSAFLEFGSGVFSPFVLSSYFYINGAKTCYSTDWAPIDNHENAARTLKGFLTEAFTHPDEWCRGEVAFEEFVSRIMRYNLISLNNDEPASAMAHFPVRYVNGSAGSLPKGLKFDFLFSCTVLEHLVDLPDVFKAFGRLVKPDGIMCHVVDFSDHAYHTGHCPHRWGYLTEEGGDGIGMNGIHLSEMVGLLESEGFETVEVLRHTEAPPEEVVANLRPQYKSLSMDDLSTHLATIVSRRKSGSSHGDAVRRERDAAFAERDALVAARDAAVAERDAAVAARDAAFVERDALASAIASATADPTPLNRAPSRQPSWWRSLARRLDASMGGRG